MGTPFLGEMRMVSFNFAPKGWALTNGQLFPINQNQALFSLLGTTFGGNGQTTFALPNMQSRIPMHFGAGLALTPRNMGEIGGAEAATLLTQGTQVAPPSPVPASTFASASAPSMSPFLALTFVIALQGIFPSRN
jgi:microcystin-dependent protein